MTRGNARFQDLAIGDTFKFGSVAFVKIAHNFPNEKTPMPQQRPNCVNLDNKHYCVVGANAPVRLMKSPDDYDDPHFGDYYDKEAEYNG